MTCYITACNIRCTGECNPTPDGRQYIGRISITETGKACQAWDSQSPHQHTYDKDAMYPDGSVKEASNYCRQPDPNSNDGLWCFTTDPNKERERCNVPFCGQLLRCIE